jgi:hypothetical protein
VVDAKTRKAKTRNEKNFFIMTLLVVFMNILGFISTCEKGERNGSSLIKKASRLKDAF